MEEIFEKSAIREKSKITTVKIDESTKKRIDSLRVYKRESYDEVMQKILEVLNICRINPERARSRLMVIDKERKRNLKGDGK